MDIEATYQRGFDYRCHGNYEDAKKEFAKVLAAESTHLQSLHQLALIMGFEGDFDASLARLGDLSAKHPENNDIRYDLAMTQMMLGDYEAACGNLRLILASDPTHEKAGQQIIYC
ncbi:MAG: tetratricopeptide repeat protein [Fimbriimonadaceae bacterium]